MLQLSKDFVRSGVTTGEGDGAAMLVEDEQLDRQGVFRKNFGPPVRPLQDDHPAGVNGFFNAC